MSTLDAALEHHRTLLASVDQLRQVNDGLSQEKTLLEQHKANLERDVLQLRATVAGQDNKIARLRPVPDSAEVENAFIQYIQATIGAAALADGNFRGMLEAVWQAAIRWDAERRRII